jgi:serine/threonine protein kinase
VYRPSSFGKYILLDRISVGGMAEVFRAKAMGVEGFTRTVAVKRILPHLAEDQRFVEMFIAEAKTAARLSHANIAQVHELGRVGSEHFIAMEYVAGRDLLSVRHQMRKSRRQVPVDLAAWIAAQIAEGLANAHEKRDDQGQPLDIVHRDVSPQNVLVSYAGAVKLIDFGIAKASNDKVPATRAGVLKGKFGYMTPEQIEGKTVDRRADIFSLGAVLHELLTNERLFDGDNEFVVLERVREANVAPPSVLNGNVPAELDRICLRALARAADQRYQHASEMAEDLSRFVYTLGLGSPSKRLRDWLRTEFAAEFAGEQDKEQRYRHFTMTSDGMVVEEPPDDDDDEPTALWTPAFDELEDRPALPMQSVPLDSTPPRHISGARPLPHVQSVHVASGARALPRQSGARPLPASQTGPLPQRHSGARPLPHSQSGPLPHPIQPGPSELGPLPGGRPSGARSPAPTAPMPVVQSNRLRVLLFLMVAVMIGAGAAWLFLLRAPSALQLEMLVVPGDQLEVTIDGQAARSTTSPVSQSLTPGRHSVTIERPGYEPWSAAVDLHQSQRLTVELRARPPVRIHFDLIPPTAQLTINGQRLTDAQLRGRLPLAPAAPATVEVSAEGHRTLTTTITPGSEPTQTISYTLEATPGSLFVDSTPPAAVFLNGKRIGRTPHFRDDLDVTQPIKLRLEAPRHRVLEETLRFGAKGTLQIERTLTPL